MTELLEKAVAAVELLSPEDQDRWAGVLLAEIAAERQWDLAISGNRQQFERLADEAIADIEAGRTLPLSPAD